MLKAIYNVVNYFNSLCSVGNNTAAEHVQLLKICGHLFVISNVCCIYGLSPSVYCVHEGTLFLLYWFVKHKGNKQLNGQLNLVCAL